MRTTHPESVLISDIVVGDRRREDYGDIDALAESIAAHGLLHPIVVDDNLNLVAGGRRLKACQHLGLTTIDTTNLGELSKAERHEIELEENLRRKDLTAYEQDRDLVKLVETAAEVLREEAKESRADSAQKSDAGFSTNLLENPKAGPAEVSTESVETSKSKGGRPPKHGVSEARIAERIGVPVQTIRDARAHVETAEAYPFMQSPGWKQYHVLEAKEKIEKLPVDDRLKAAKLIDQPGIPPQAAIPILNNLAQMPQENRETVFQLNESADLRDRDLALTKAADRPPMPDPRLALIQEAMFPLRKAVRLFPSDPEVPDFQAVIVDLKNLSERIERKEHSNADAETTALRTA